MAIEQAEESVGRCPGPSVQDILAGDVREAPVVLRTVAPPADLGTDDVSIDRYFSPQWHDREVAAVWQKCWQMACRVEDIPSVGDHVVYDIAHDSLIVIRTGPGADEVAAYVNACLHRATMLRVDDGHIDRFRCPFHGFTWNLDGSLAHIPAQWDFPQVVPEEFCLPKAKVGIWGGFVFVNLDPDCAPLTDYLEILPEHFADFPPEDRWNAAHVAK